MNGVFQIENDQFAKIDQIDCCKNRRANFLSGKFATLQKKIDEVYIISTVFIPVCMPWKNSCPLAKQICQIVFDQWVFWHK